MAVSTSAIPEFKERELDDITRDKLSAFFDEVKRLKSQYNEHHSNELTFMEKCRELQEQLNRSGKQRDVLADNSENIDIKIESIKTTISNTQTKMKEMAMALSAEKDNLQQKRKQNDELMQQLENITNELEAEREDTTKSLEKRIDALLNRKNVEISKLNEIRTVTGNLYGEVERIEAEKNEIMTCVKDLTGQIERTNTEIANEKNKYKNLEMEIANLESDLKEQTTTCELNKNKLISQNQALSSARNQVKEASNLVSENSMKLVTRQNNLESLEDELKLLSEDNVEQREKIEQQREIIEHLNDQIDAKTDMKNALSKKMNLLNDSITKMEKETVLLLNKKENWYQKCSDIKKEIKMLENKVTIFNKQFDAAQREKELIETYHETKSKDVTEVEIMMLTAESSIKALDNEISSNSLMLKKLKKIIEGLHTDLKKTKYEALVKENKLKKLHLKYNATQATEDELQRKIVENEQLLKQQENLIEAVKLDKNVYNKSLIDQKEEMKEFKRNFNSLNHAINQIKMELSEKDTMYITEHFNVDQVDKDVLIIRGKIEAINKKTMQTEKYIDDVLKTKLNKLNKLIVKSDDILKSQYKQYHAILSEAKHLSTNLMEKNQEIVRVKEEIRLLNSLFAKGNAAYHEKYNLLITSQHVRDNLQSKMQSIQHSVSEIDVLKSHILSMEHELLAENLKVHALQDELSRPVNIHRWRRLKDSNPEIFTLIQRSHKLTKELLTQNKKIYEKQQQIHNKEKLYVNLRKILARQPGNEAREQLNLYLNTLQEKKSKLKLLSNQLNIYQNKVHLLKHEINILHKDKNALKIQYFKVMKKKQQQQQNPAVIGKQESDEQDNNKENENENENENANNNNNINSNQDDISGNHDDDDHKEKLE